MKKCLKPPTRIGDLEMFNVSIVSPFLIRSFSGSSLSFSGGVMKIQTSV